MHTLLRYAWGVGLALTLCAVRPAPVAAVVVDRYVATVNQRVITSLDVLTQLQPLRQQLMETSSGRALEQKLAEAYQKVLTNLIERALILEEFARISEKDGMKIPEQLVDNRANEIVHERFHNNRSAFFDALAAERLTMEEWRVETKDYLVLSILRRKEVMDRVVVMPRDVRALYASRQAKYREPEKLQLRVIVLDGGTTDAEQQAQHQAAERLRAQALQGGDFAALAKQHSTGYRAADGGDWGWMVPTELRAELAAAVVKIPIGQVGPVVAASNKLYVIKVEARQAERVRPLNEVYADLSAEVRQAEFERLYKDWIQRLQRKYYVKILAAE